MRSALLPDGQTPLRMEWPVARRHCSPRVSRRAALPLSAAAPRVRRHRRCRPAWRLDRAVLLVDPVGAVPGVPGAGGDSHASLAAAAAAAGAAALAWK